MTTTPLERGLRIAADLTTVLSALRGLAYATIIVGAPIVAFKALPMLGRAVTVLERLDERVGIAFDAAAPVGREIIETGVDTLQAIDAESLGESLTEAVKRRLDGRKGGRQR